MTQKVSLLWSGGLDSTVLLAYLCTLGFNVTCYHILIRNGIGKDIRESKAIKDLLLILKKRYRFGFVELKHRIRPCEDRNLKMIKVLSDLTSNPIVLGAVKEGTPENLIGDCDHIHLSKKSNHDVFTWDTFEVQTHAQIYAMGLALLGKGILDKTWSCQLWWRKPCGKCFSCKRRKKIESEVEQVG